MTGAVKGGRAKALVGPFGQSFKAPNQGVHHERPWAHSAVVAVRSAHWPMAKHARLAVSVLQHHSARTRRWLTEARERRFVPNEESITELNLFDLM